MELDSNVIELGEGEEIVYCFYYPAYKTGWRYPMKIGSTTRSLEERLMGYRTVLPEPLHVAVVIRCQNARLLEQIIHTVLPPFRDALLVKPDAYPAGQENGIRPSGKYGSNHSKVGARPFIPSATRYAST